MPIIENHTEHAFEFPSPSRTTDNKDGTKSFTPSSRAELISIPPLRPKKNPDESVTNVPGRVTVTKEQLERMQKHPVASKWFGPTSLVVLPDEPKGKD